MCRSRCSVQYSTIVVLVFSKAIPNALACCCLYMWYHTSPSCRPIRRCLYALVVLLFPVALAGNGGAVLVCWGLYLGSRIPTCELSYISYVCCLIAPIQFATLPGYICSRHWHSAWYLPLTLTSTWYPWAGRQHRASTWLSECPA